MLSTSKYLGTKIDIRSLQLYGEFYNLCGEKVCALIKSFYEWSTEILSDSFLLKWCYDEKPISDKKLKEVLCKYSDEVFRALSLSGMVRYGNIQNSQEMQTYLKNIEHYVLSSNVNELPFPWQDLPTDYGRLFKELVLCNYNDIDAICEGFRFLSEVENKHAEWYHLEPDCVGSFICNRENSDYSGTFHINISIVALDDSFSDYVVELQKYARKLANDYSTMNIHLGLSPWMFGTAYRTVFQTGYPKSRLPGHNKKNSITLNYSNNLTKYHYCSALEWMNILSQDTIGHLDSNLPKSSHGITVKSTAFGGMEIRANCDIMDFDISQAKEIKAAIYSALFPGGREWSYTNKFLHPIRSMWQIVPIFSDEFEVYMGRIFICHKVTEELQTKFGLDL